MKKLLFLCFMLPSLAFAIPCSLVTNAIFSICNASPFCAGESILIQMRPGTSFTVQGCNFIGLSLLTPSGECTNCPYRWPCYPEIDISVSGCDCSGKKVGDMIVQCSNGTNITNEVTMPNPCNQARFRFHSLCQVPPPCTLRSCVEPLSCVCGDSPVGVSLSGGLTPLNDTEGKQVTYQGGKVYTDLWGNFVYEFIRGPDGTLLAPEPADASKQNPESPCTTR